MVQVVQPGAGQALQFANTDLSPLGIQACMLLMLSNLPELSATPRPNLADTSRD